jgi:hypothetical protein
MLLRTVRQNVFFLIALAITYSAQGQGGSTCQVEYRVTGLSKVSVTLTNETGSTEQLSVKPPWSKSFVSTNGSFVYLNAQLLNLGPFSRNRDIRAEIWVGGVLFKHAEASGVGSAANVTGTVACPAKSQ